MAAGEVALAFHERTKHTHESIRRGGRMLDWSTKPDPFKRYDAGAGRIALTEPALSEMSLLDALATRAKGGSLDAATLGRILVWGVGVLRKQTFGDDVYHFRTYASAGALYPVEVYVVVGDVAGVEAGVFHVDPLDKTLVRLRSGDHRMAVAEASAGESAVRAAAGHLVLTGIPWRTCWKYGERGYRHLFWDSGTILANVFALSSSAGVGAKLVAGFDDELVADLLGVDGTREFPLFVVPLGAGAESAGGEHGALEVAAPPPAPGEERLPALEEVHGSGRLGAGETERWRGAERELTHPQLAPTTGRTVERVIRRRGSARAFGDAPMPAEALRLVLERASAHVETDYGSTHRVRPFLAVHNVDGLEPGAYTWDDGTLHLLRARDVRLDAAYLCLEQRLGGMGAATVFLMTDLGEALVRFGDRGYRVAQVEGGLMLGRLDLAAHALGHAAGRRSEAQWGATGLTFYDDDVTEFFAPRSEGLSCIVVCALGERRSRPLPLA